jgi:acyl-CoA synthetase (AMP-forming)/AMP-acid ligase II
MPRLTSALRRAGILDWESPRTLWRMARVLAGQSFGPGALCALAAARYPDQLAIVDECGALSYAELQSRVQRLGASLRARHGIGPGRALGVLCRNHRSFVEALLAGSTLGADVVLLNTEFSAPQLSRVLADYRLGCIVVDDELSPVVEKTAHSAPRVVADSPDGSIEALIASAKSAALPSRRRRGRVVILTSGTTGAPKGAARVPTFRALAGPLTTLLSELPLRARDRLFVAPPLFHGFGLAYLALALFLGATLVLRRRFDPAELVSDVARHRVDVVIAVPTMLRRVLELPPTTRSRVDLSRVKAWISSGAALGSELGTRFMQAHGPLLYNLYGSSETGFGALATPQDLQAAPGTVGHRPLGTELRILGADGHHVATGAVGRLFVRSGLLFAGYEGGGNKEVIGGFMSTGDMAHVDANGRLFIDGRADDMIVSGGENVFPQEVEELLSRHEAVAEAAVVGVADDEFGQRLAAFVVRRGEVTAEALRGYVKANLARYKVPRDVVFVDELPRNAAGKVLKRQLGA